MLFHDLLSVGFQNDIHVIDPHIGNAIHKYLNVHQKALEVLVQSQFRQQPVVELSAFQQFNHIITQRALLTRYAHDHGYTNLKILVDDGYTGTNFNRPGVQEGFALIKQGLVGCWLVKDLSRFGRDYLTVGQYTDIIFPSYDVRFIAVNDGVDSNRGDSEGFAAIRNLFNEW